MLTKKQLKQLRKEIVLNSLYIKDYSNSLYIDPKTCCNFFDSYIEELYYIAEEDGFNSDDISDIIDKYDNIENLYNYYLCYEDEPLLQDDFIASKPINNSDAIIIYNVDDYYIITGMIYLSGLYMKSAKITRNKIYHDGNGDPYFNKYGSRYYLSDFMRKDF